MSHSFWSGRRVLVTGNTGFKGSWLCLWLNKLGASVYGFALEPPTEPSMYASARVGSCVDSTNGDIRDFDAICGTIRKSRAEIVIHLAAQALVRRSYENPLKTYSTNVMGTVHVLESARRCGVRLALNITSDKCYENREVMRGYVETDSMGGYDPYSSSKGCAELVTSAYRRSYAGDGSELRIASARAGNVIGGGDWAQDRLVPDCIRAFSRNETVVLRHPQAVRPWQHVLEPLSGYLSYAEHLIEDPSNTPATLNFGPFGSKVRPVRDVVGGLVTRWGNGAAWCTETGHSPHEAGILALNSSLARDSIGWHPRLTFDETLDFTAEWYRAYNEGARMDRLTLQQITAYEAVKPGDEK